jgi:hypothetical protein
MTNPNTVQGRGLTLGTVLAAVFSVQALIVGVALLAGSPGWL